MVNTLVQPTNIIECTTEHIGVSPLTEKFTKNKSQTSAVCDHMLVGKTVDCPEDPSILAKSTCSLKIEIQESILIKLLKLSLHKNICSVPLFDLTTIVERFK